MQRSALPITAALGNTVEWFDFAVYGYFAHAIGAAFFPGRARCGAFSFSYSLSVALFGGSAPLVVGWMVNAEYWSSGPLLYLVMLAVLAWWAWSRKPPYLKPRPS